MAMQMIESNRAVILLEFPAGAEMAERLAQGNRQRWSRETYGAARMLASDLETDQAQERASLETSDQIVNEILQRLARNSDMRRAMATAGLEPAPEQVTYMTPADIAASGIGPAPNSAIVIKDIGIMSVPARVSNGGHHADGGAA